MARDASVANAGYFKTPVVVANQIGSALRPMAGVVEDKLQIRTLDPSCGYGEALQLAVNGLWQNANYRVDALTWGVELNEQRASGAVEALGSYRVVCGDSLSMRFSRDAFGFMLLNPPYDNDREYGRLEIKFLDYWWSAVAYGGVLALIVKRRDLEGCADILARRFDQFSFWNFPEQERAAFDQVVVMCRRAPLRVMNETNYDLLVEFSRGFDVVDFDPDTVIYNVPGVAVGTSLVFSLEMPTAERLQEARQALLSTPLLQRLSVQDGFDSRVRVAMPLSEGHVALLAASGVMDQIPIERPDGGMVLSRGVVRKRIEEREVDGKTEVVERAETSITLLDLETYRLGVVRS